MSTHPADPAALRNVPLLAALTDDQLAALQRASHHRVYAAQRMIVRAGEHAEGLHIILSGRVKVVIDDGEGRELMFAALGPTDFFGEMSLIDGAPYSASFLSHCPCEILYVPAKAFAEHIQESPGAYAVLLRVAVQRIRYAEQKIHSLTFMDVYGRVARTLLENSLEENGEWLVGPGCEQIASMVGASREMVNRVVRDMIKAGLVRRRRRKLIVEDRTGLANVPPRDGRTSGGGR